MLLSLVASRFGIGGIIVLLIIMFAFGGLGSIFGGGQQAVSPSGGSAQTGQQACQADEMSRLACNVYGSTDRVWAQLYQAQGQAFRAPKLVLYSQAGRSGCGAAQSAMGPFYCPLDKRIYIDTSFFRDLERRFRGCSGKACEFAQAYVISHEVGHHIQNLLGVLPRAQQMQQQVGNRAEANRIQVRVELQADCFAGVWAARSNQRWKFIEPGDVEAAMQTAAAIGDDRIQKQTQGTVVPDSFTHGSSAQRQRWFSIGLKEGKVSACNTFNAPNV